MENPLIGIFTDPIKLYGELVTKDGRKLSEIPEVKAIIDQARNTKKPGFDNKESDRTADSGNGFTKKKEKSIVKEESSMSSIQEILSRTQKRLDEISGIKDKLYIVNAGTTNNGKSSTFNSLLMLEGKCVPGQNVFRVQDIRTTVKNQEAEYRGGAYLLDTPGLEATVSDDEMAMKAYQNASLIVFVHAIKKGELHENELKWIQKIEGLLTSSYFSKHFCLVLTHRDDDLNDEKQELSSIRAKITEQLKGYCQLTDIPMFCISNSVFEKGMKLKKEALKRASQVGELKAYIDEKLPVYRTEQRSRIHQMTERVKEEARKELKKKRKAAMDKQSSCKQKADKRYAALKSDVERLADDVHAAVSDYKRKKKLYKNAKDNADFLERKHRNERW